MPTVPRLRCIVKSRYEAPREGSHDHKFFLKSGGHVHDRHTERSTRQYDQQRVDMLNSKKYVPKITRRKTLYQFQQCLYHIHCNRQQREGKVLHRGPAKHRGCELGNIVLCRFIMLMIVPSPTVSRYHQILLDTYSSQLSAEELQTRLVTDFVTIMTEAQTIQLSHQDILKGRLFAVNAALVEVQPDKDQTLFVDSNIRPFSIPKDWVFEPCASYYDTVCHILCSLCGVEDSVKYRAIFASIRSLR